MWATRALQMAGNARRAKRLRDDVVVDLTDDGGKESDAKLLKIKEDGKTLSLFRSECPSRPPGFENVDLILLLWFKKHKSASYRRKCFIHKKNYRLVK